MQSVILAGGLGTRLQAITKEIPKALVPVRGRPFAAYQLDWLARQGVTEVVYCIGYKGSQIVDFVGDGSAWGLRVSYADEGRELLGTGGALRHALATTGLRPSFFVLYGDSFLPIAYPPVLERFARSGKPALMTVMRNDNRWDRSNVVYDPPLVALYDKHCDERVRATMTHIDYGLLVLSSNLVETEIPKAAVVDLADVLGRLSRRGALAGYEVAQRFYEVGSPTGLADFTRYAEQEGL
ncbi:sugar phosphate nucleotidyltransferase [Reyranella sp.]|uniref:sugar phosphate nucleotidyltransferase n=1 Tax=Reyranella sp. TaxID=1929291 RepID=UPI003BABC5D8